MDWPDVERIARGHNGKIFSVEFIKRSTGEIRRMACRLNVRKGVKGKDPDRRGRDTRNRLLTVYEMAGEDSGFKCIPLDNVTSITLAEGVQDDTPTSH